MKNMKFKEGCMVEVCRSNGDAFQSWFRARIISSNADSDCYQVEYQNLVNAHGKRCVEDVQADAVRPEPPHMTQTKKLAPGDMIEIHDNHSWKAGKVVKVLPGRLFVVKLMESSQRRTFHLSVIRARLFWDSKGWLHNVQASRDHLLKRRFRILKNSVFDNQYLKLSAKPNAGYNGHEPVEAACSSNKLGTKCLKRKTGSHVECGYEANILKSEGGSSNELDYVLHSDKDNSKQSFSESRFVDAQSASEYPKRRQNESFPENGVECKIHELETDAYHSTMRFFYASGLLTWGRESLLTTLRQELHISNDEHSAELSRLLSRKAL